MTRWKVLVQAPRSQTDLVTGKKVSVVKKTGLILSEEAGVACEGYAIPRSTHQPECSCSLHQLFALVSGDNGGQTGYIMNIIN